jgi:hypothetical protein
LNGAGCRRKGAEWEREVTRRLAAIFGEGRVRRGLQYRDGAECADVIAPGLWVECKRGRQTNPRAALRQATSDSEGKGMWAIAVCKDDHEPAFAVIALDDLCDLLAEWHALRSA